MKIFNSSIIEKYLGSIREREEAIAEAKLLLPKADVRRLLKDALLLSMVEQKTTIAHFKELVQKELTKRSKDQA